MDRITVEDWPQEQIGEISLIGPIGSQTPNEGRCAPVWLLICRCGYCRLVTDTWIEKAKSTGSVARGCDACWRHRAVRASGLGSWRCMIDRCVRPKNKDFKRYGAKGVRVCDRWLFGEDGKTGFECFAEDMGPRPSRQHSIHRLEDADYEPQSCVWATDLEQQNGRTNNIRVTISGETKTLSQWARHFSISRATITTRMRAGWHTVAAITSPTRPRRRRRSRKSGINT